MKRLRVAQVLVLPVLVWDDGADLAPGPDLEKIALTLSQVADYPRVLRDQLVELEQRLLAEEAEPAEPAEPEA